MSGDSGVVSGVGDGSDGGDSGRAEKTVAYSSSHSSPTPPLACDVWDKKHVRMPFSRRATYETPHGSRMPLWPKVKEALTRPFETWEDIREAILSYNPCKRDSARYPWRFDALELLFTSQLSAIEASDHLLNTLPFMAGLALQLPYLLGPTPVPLLLAGGDVTSVTLGQMQVASLLANAFFCTMPFREHIGHHNRRGGRGGPDLPSFSFNRLFEARYDRRKTTVAKLQCILHYFARVMARNPSGCVTFSRLVASPTLRWRDCKAPLCQLSVRVDGVIEAAGSCALQADFANMYIGGGVLSHGCVQEEIRFLICPELIVSRLLAERMQDDEAMLMVGAERFSNYTGYAKTFRYGGDHQDLTAQDAIGRRKTYIVGMDASHFRFGDTDEQFSAHAIEREMTKAYAAFNVTNADVGVAAAEGIFSPGPGGLEEVPKFPVVSGRWGCGAFNGDADLKAWIQLAAASAAGRDIEFVAWSDEDHVRELTELHAALMELPGKSFTVGDLCQIIFPPTLDQQRGRGCPWPHLRVSDRIRAYLVSRGQTLARESSEVTTDLSDGAATARLRSRSDDLRFSFDPVAMTSGVDAKKGEGGQD